MGVSHPFLLPNEGGGGGWLPSLLRSRNPPPIYVEPGGDVYRGPLHMLRGGLAMYYCLSPQVEEKEESHLGQGAGEKKAISECTLKGRQPPQRILLQYSLFFGWGQLLSPPILKVASSVC